MKRFTGMVVLAAALLMAPAAQAHKVTVFAWVQGDTIHTESKFSGGKRVNGGRIEAYDRQNEKVHEGITDADGNYSFPKPKGVDELRIVLVAGMGHTAHWVIRPEELGFATAAVQAPQDPSVHGGQAKPYGSTGLSAEAMQQLVERAVERKLAPLRAQMAEQAWGLRDIVSGIGYILGLMGLASYIHHRKGQNDSK
jgi:nickel transport protein